MKRGDVANDIPAWRVCAPAAASRPGRGARRKARARPPVGVRVGAGDG